MLKRYNGCTICDPFVGDKTCMHRCTFCHLGDTLGSASKRTRHQMYVTVGPEVHCCDGESCCHGEEGVLGFRLPDGACSNPKCGQRRFVPIREFKAQPGFSCKLRPQELCESRGGRPGLPSPINLRFLWMLSNTSTPAANIENLGHLVL